MRHTFLALALSASLAAPAGAQQLKLQFNDGRVTVDATSVPVRTILTEWAKLGSTQVIGGDKVSGSPLTLKLVDVPEAQALEIILRSVAGYMAAPRSAAAAGASMYDRILVMATSTAPAAPAATRPTPSGPGSPGTQRFVPQPQRPPLQSNDDPDQEVDPNPPNPPVFTFPQPGQQPGMFGNPPPGTVTGQPVTMNPTTGAPQAITVNPQPGVYPGTSPATAPGSRVPGMIAPPQPGQPTPVVRPPGE